MHQGNWKCSGCGGTITELPFEPRSESGLTCRSCYAKSKGSSNQSVPDMQTAPEPTDIPDDAGLAGEPAPDDAFAGMETSTPSERPSFKGDWTCAGCGAPITSLPFQPRDTSGLKCIDCFKKSKG